MAGCSLLLAFLPLCQLGAATFGPIARLLGARRRLDVAKRDGSSWHCFEVEEEKEEEGRVSVQLGAGEKCERIAAPPRRCKRPRGVSQECVCFFLLQFGSAQSLNPQLGSPPKLSAFSFHLSARHETRQHANTQHKTRDSRLPPRDAKHIHSRGPVRLTKCRERGPA